MELGKKHESLGSMATPEKSNEKEPKVTYPGFSLRDEHAAKFLDETEAKVGEEFAATVRICVTGLTDDSFGKSVQFDVIELDDIAPEHEEGRETYGESSGSGSGSGEGEEESDEEETKALGYKRKKSKKEAPPISAKDLAE